MYRDSRKLSLAGVVILLGALALTIAGCGGSSASSNVLPPSQQVFNYFLNAGSPDIKTMDPAYAQDFYSSVPVSIVYPGLLELDANSQPQPFAAAAMPVYDASANTYTFKVRPGLRWTDGTPIDANTFAYSINRAESPCTASTLTYYLFPIKDAAAFSTEKCAADGVTVSGKIPSLIGDSLNVPDNQTLVITLGAPAPYFLQAICYPISFAQPKQLIDKYGTKNWTNHLTDNGGFGGSLYKVTLWNHTGKLDVVANPNYWGTAPKLHAVDFTVFQSTAAEYTTYLSGRLDVGDPPAAQYQQAKARSDFHEVPYLAIEYAQPTWTQAPFNDVRVRQAFDLALDKTVLADHVLSGRDTATNHIVPQGMSGYDPNLTAPDGTTNLTGNVAKATALMQQYANAQCGGQLSKCPAVTLSASNDPTLEILSQAMVVMWQTAFPGYKINTSFLDFNTLLNQIYGPKPPQFYVIGWSADYADAQDWLSLQFGPTSLNNTGLVHVPEANTLMTQADQDLNPTTRVQEYNQAEQLLVDDGAWIQIYQSKTAYSLPTYVHNFVYNSLQEVPPSSWDTMYLTAH